ncbi:hypothetical protein FGO68_gene14117 [Halteria grandinella]|uniref:Uncharacterized protein n=1 Tax=Halteria grandinella TaxID=5974 RepID=A0A8J8T4S0_HALGN|nr:hypothetical protein FGO68_gene14117 [Halteria grandinella]
MLCQILQSIYSRHSRNKYLLVKMEIIPTTQSIKFQLGRLRSKYLIIRILTEAFPRREALHYLSYTCANIRSIVIDSPHVVSRSLCERIKPYNLYTKVKIPNPRFIGMRKVASTDASSSCRNLKYLSNIQRPFNVYVHDIQNLKFIRHVQLISKDKVLINKLIITDFSTLNDPDYRRLLRDVNPRTLELSIKYGAPPTNCQQMFEGGLPTALKYLKMYYYRSWATQVSQQVPQRCKVDTLHLAAYESYQVRDVLKSILPKLLILELPLNHNPMILQQILKSREILEGIDSLVVYTHEAKFDEQKKNLFFKLPIDKKWIYYHEFQISNPKARKFMVILRTIEAKELAYVRLSL